MYLALSLIYTAVVLIAAGAVLFGCAGTFAVPAFWLYLAVFGVLSLAVLGLIYRASPDLIKERLRPGKGEQDRVSVAAMMTLLFVHWAIAGFDVGRLHVSDTVPGAVQILGLLGFVGGFAFVTWAMLVNRFFSSAVRLQADRGQRVITSGPYGIIRHPGYTGGLLFLLCSGLALNSWLSIVPMALCVPLMVRRTVIEDAMLRQSLEGYEAYAGKIRYRLLPGVW